MLKPLTALFTLAFIFPVSCALACVADLPKITEFVVLGNKEISTEAIVKASRLKLGQEVSPTDMEEAQRWVMATGNFGSPLPNPRNGVRVSYEIKGESAIVTIKVVENPIIKDIAINGSGPIPPADVLSAIETKKQSVLNLPRLQNDVQVIQHLYDLRGYQAFVTEDIGIKDGVLNIPIRIGTITSINLKGLNRVKERDVRKRMKLKVDDYYNVNEMKRELTNLFNTFRFEQIEPTFSFPSPGHLDLVLNFKEKARK